MINAQVWQWFSQLNCGVGPLEPAVKNDIRPDRHLEAANQPYTDGHVDLVSGGEQRRMDRSRG
jgi:hypothetical protein